MSEFKKSFFGYDTEQVEKQLEDIKQTQKKAWEEMSRQMETMEQENQRLQQQVEKLQDDNKMAAKTLIDAQAEAERIRAEAKAENDRITRNAKLVAEKLQEFSRVASDLINSTSTEVQQLSQDLAMESSSAPHIPCSDDLNVSDVVKKEPEIVVSSQVYETEHPDGSVSAEVVETSTQAEEFRKALAEDKKLSESINECGAGSVADAVIGCIRK